MTKRLLAQTLTLSACAFFVFAPYSSADITVYDAEAERARYEGMTKERMDGITHLIATEKYEGSVTFEFTVPETGTYLIEAKTYAPDTRHDSFNVRIDNGETRVWHVPQSSTWQWNALTISESEDGTFALTEGTHELTFYGRELTRIDRVTVTHITKDTVVAPVEDALQQPSKNDTWYVHAKHAGSGSGTANNPFPTITQALQTAQPGDVIRVFPGIYTEEIKTTRKGTKDAPITLTSAESERPIIDLKWKGNGPIFAHSNYILENFEVRNFRQGIRIENASHVTVRNNDIHHGEHECVRIRHFSRQNIVENNTIHFCGATSATKRLSNGNGEGIYLGTAPEQRERNGGKADTSTHNQVRNNRIYDVTESVDVKEDASYTLVEGNELYKNSDANSGAINVRGDNNSIKGNTAYDNTGSGFRFGGDAGVENANGVIHNYGQNNIVRNNIALRNGQYGYKLMVKTQDFDCSNSARENKNGDTNVSGTHICFQ